MWWFTSLLQFSSFFFFLKFDYVPQCQSLWGHLTKVPCASLIFRFFHQIWEVFSHFFKYPFCSFLSLGLPQFLCSVESHNSLRLCLYFSNLYSFYSSNSVISTILSSNSWILSSDCSNLPLTLSSDVFIFSYCIFQLQNFVCFFLGFLFIEIYILLTYCFLDFPHIVLQFFGHF